MKIDEFGRTNVSNGVSFNRGIWEERQKQLKKRSKKSKVTNIPVTKDLNDKYVKGSK